MMLTAALGFALLSPPSSPAAKPGTLTPQVVGAALYKNGYAVIARDLRVPKSGEYWLPQLPQASIGTLWFTISSGGTLRRILQSSSPTGTAVMPLTSLFEIAGANVGKVVRVGLQNGDDVTKKVLTGRILGVVGGPAQPGMFGGPILRLSSNGQEYVFPFTMVSSLSAAEGSLVTQRKVLTGGGRGLKFSVDAPQGATIRMMSLESGLSWSPAYALDLSDDDQVSLVAKATLINDLVPLRTAKVRLVTGFPNLPFLGQIDPLVAGQMAMQMAGGFGGGGFGGMGGPGGAMMNQAARPASRDEMQNFAASMPAVGASGEQMEDLFFYSLPNVTLEFGERSYQPLFRTTSTYRHVYRWDVRNAVENDTNYRGIAPTDPQDVWHTIRFKNESDQPLTTAVATMMKGESILGQDTLTYTPRGSEVEVRLSKGLDIRVEAAEEEVDRQRQTLNVPNRGVFDLVTVKGTLRLVNTKSEAVQMRISKEVTGEVTEPGGAEVTKLAKGLRAINSDARLVWKPKLEPRQSLEITYTYRVYVAS